MSTWDFLDPLILKCLPKEGQMVGSEQATMRAKRLVELVDYELNGPAEGLTWYERHQRHAELRPRVMARLRALANQGKVVQEKRLWDTVSRWRSTEPVPTCPSPPSVEEIEALAAEQRPVRITTSWGEVISSKINEYDPGMSRIVLVDEVVDADQPVVKLTYGPRLRLDLIEKIEVDAEAEAEYRRLQYQMAVQQIAEALGRLRECGATGANLAEVASLLIEEDRAMLRALASA